MQKQVVIDQYWKPFLEHTNRSSQEKYFSCFYFDTTEASANHLLGLVLSGRKRATASSGLYFKNSNTPLPKPGDLSIVTDWNGTPHCVIETTKVTALPFREITFDICKREGEDETLASWQAGHIRFFTDEGMAEGYAFSWDMPVVFEDFEVIYKAQEN